MQSRHGNPDRPPKASKERTLHVNKDAFAERLWHAIKRSGLTYKETARRAQEHLPPGARISDVSVWSYAKGRSLPRRMTHVEALSKVLGVDTRDLLGSPGSEPGVGGGFSDQVAGEAVTPEVQVEDLGNGRAMLRISQMVTWPVALEVLRLLKGTDEAADANDDLTSSAE